MKQLKYLVFYTEGTDEYRITPAMKRKDIEGFMKLYSIKPIAITPMKELANSMAHNCNLKLTKKYLTPYGL